MSSTIYLASEGQEVIVDVLGRQAVASVLLGSLDVQVHLMLRLEPLVTTEYIKHYKRLNVFQINKIRQHFKENCNT